jgi:hypothetical protein
MRSTSVRHDAAVSSNQQLHGSPVLHAEAHHELQRPALTLLHCCCLLLVRHGHHQQACLCVRQQPHTLVTHLQESKKGKRRTTAA